MNIAVTGGLGSGKSTVSKLLARSLQAELIDTDQLCRLQLSPGTEGFNEFVHCFGNTFLTNDGTIDRQLLRQAVFDDAAKRNALEKILHPIVQRQVSLRCRVCKQQNSFLVIEVPLLYEVGWQDEFDACIVVYVPDKTSIQRVKARDTMTVANIKLVLDAQIPINKKLEYSDFIVDNSGTFVSTVQQTAWLSRMLTMN